jgi:hypothetical protein
VAASFGGSGVGATFNLGQTNTVNASSILTGTPTSATAMLNVKNGSALAGSFGVLGQLTSSSSPASSAGVKGVGLGQAPGVWGAQDVGTGVYGTTTGGYGVRGKATSGIGVYGLHAGTSGTAPGVRGETSSTAANANGVYGVVTQLAAGNGSAAVRGENRGTGTYGIGVWGSQDGAGIGVYGKVTNTTGYPNFAGLGVGVEGEANNGVVGRGYDRGVVGALYPFTVSCDGTFAVGGCANSDVGVYGNSSANDGVHGESSSGYGVYGTSSSSDGVHGVGVLAGVAGASSGGDGIYGETTGSGYAGYFYGKTYVQGTLSASNKQFKIDDPLDPAHKYLQHTSVESPDMMDIYNGNVTTDAHGFATVRLPAWFEALNRSFRYQLTILGRSFAQAIVWREIHDNRFTIRTNQPHVKVSWLITGIRHDPYANAHRTQVVVPKAKADQGKYLYPQLYGKPRRAAIGYEKRVP